MKRIISMILLAVCLAGCGSSGTITEDYSGPGVHAKSIGEGKTTFNFNYKGKGYIAVLGEDGKYHAVTGETKGEAK